MAVGVDLGLRPSIRVLLQDIGVYNWLAAKARLIDHQLGTIGVLPGDGKALMIWHRGNYGCTIQGNGLRLRYCLLLRFPLPLL